MTATNGIRTEYKIKRLAAAVALAVAAMLGVSCLSPARADAAGTSDGNLVIDVPTTVPCALMADGTVVSPSEWKITTSGNAYIASASASGFPANVEWSAKTTDLAAAQAGSVEVSGTGDAASVAGPSDPAAAKLAPSAGFEWAFSKLDAGKNGDIIGKAAGGTAVLGSVTFTFAKNDPGSAFAIYSADDNSLTFYKRANVPAAGQMFEGKTATEVFIGLETEEYGSAGSVPWAGHAADIASVTVADAGIAPVSTKMWFINMSSLRSADLSKLDTSHVASTYCMFNGCSSLTSLDLSSFDTGKLTNASIMFAGCSALTSLDLSSFDTGNVTNMSYLFNGCSALQKVTFGAGWKWVGTNGYLPTPNSAYIAGADGKWYDTDGNGYAPKDIPSSKAMTYTAVPPSRPKTAFAVYSADDNSLSFYKRAGVPSAGEQFEGKTATEVYEGVEDASYTVTDGAPWSGHAADIASVTVADAGVAPVSTACWFLGTTKLSSVSLAGLDTSNVTDMSYMFAGCESLTSLDVSHFNTSKVERMCGLFAYCESLATLDVSSFDTSKVTDMRDLFMDCTALTALDVSSFDTSNVTDMSDLFYGCESLATLDVSSFDTSKVERICGLFNRCLALTSLDVSSFDTVNVTDMSGLFQSCASLTSLDLSSFDTANVTDMGALFTGCNKLQEITFSENWKWVGTDGYLPTPFKTYIEGADGKWYDTDGNGYAPKDIPSSKAMTYTAVAPKKAFAVYSSDDNSLNLYKRTGVPSAGEQFEGKTATEVYEGVEDASYTATDGAPWGGHAADITSVTVADAGVAPVSTAYWFKGASKLKSMSLAGLDTSQTTSMDGMFDGCSSLEALDLSSMSTRRVASMSAFLGGCDSLTELSIGSEFAWVGDDCYPPTGDWKQGSTGTDYSESDIPPNKTDKYTRTKTAFAVYSADDNSLSFYKRISVPAAGEQFEGKVATEVFTGFETETYGSAGNIPWASHVADIASVAVIDEGIAPVSIRMWFRSMSALKSVDLSKLDTSDVGDMSYLFEGCSTLTSLDVSHLDTANVRNMSFMFANCLALTSLDLTTFDTANVTNITSLFGGCSALTSLDLSSFNTANVTNISGLFYGCESLTSLDLSSFDTRKVTGMHNTFDRCKALQKVAFGAGWKWIGTNGYLPTPNSAYIAGADGKWYDTKGNGYAPADIPSNKAMTYTAVPPARPKTAFAVYSADDNSLSFYKRVSVPSAGEQFEGKTVTAVYTGIETDGFTPKWTAEHGSNLESVTVADEGIAPKSTASWFKECRNLVSSEVAKLDMSKCKDISYMFSGCERLMSLDLSSWDTSSLENISYMLESCLSLKEINVSCWDVSNVTNMENAFSVCRMVRKLDLSTWNNAKTSDMTNMFAGMTQLEEVKLGNGFRWVGSNPYLPTPSDDCIYGADGKWHAQSDNRSYDPNEIPVGKADVYSAHPAIAPSPIVTVTGETKAGSTLTATVQGLPAGENTVSYEWQTIKKEDYDNGGSVWGGVDHLDPKSATLATDSMYDGKYVRCKVTVRNDDYFVEPGYSNVFGPMTTPKTAFAVYSATDGSLSFYNRAEVPKQGSMFLGKRATAVYTGFETKTSIPGWMLNYSSSIKTVTVYDEGIAPIGTGHWFAELRNMKTADVSKLDMSKCKTISCMFTDCTSLETLDLSAWDTRSLTSMSQAFQNCTSLTKLNVSGWDVSKVTDMDLAFAEDRALSSLDLSTWDNSAATTMKDVFSMMDSLSEVSLGSKFKFVGTRPSLPEQTGHVTGFDGKWYAKSTGAGYAPADVPSYKAETYYATKALRDAAVGVAWDPVDDDSTAVPAAASTCKVQGESTTQKDAMGKQQLVETASKGSDKAIVPEGVEKAAVKKSGE